MKLFIQHNFETSRYFFSIWLYFENQFHMLIQSGNRIIYNSSWQTDSIVTTLKIRNYILKLFILTRYSDSADWDSSEYRVILKCWIHGWPSNCCWKFATKLRKTTALWNLKSNYRPRAIFLRKKSRKFEICFKNSIFL